MRSDKLKQAGLFLLILAIYISFMTVTKIGCPIRWLTGIPCPGCGMSRALFALLRLDFADAFSFHPMIYPLLLFLPWYFLGGNDTSRSRKIRKILLAVMIILAILLWIYRIFHEDSIVHIDLAEGAVIKCLKQLQQ